MGLTWLTFLNWYWLPLFPMFVVFYVSALRKPIVRRSTPGGGRTSELVAGFMVEYGSTAYLLFMLGEYVRDYFTMCAMAAILFMGGWLRRSRCPPFTWVPGVIWFVLKYFHVLHVCDGEGDRAALPLRPTDAARLEGVPAAVAGDGVIVAGVLQFRRDRAEMRSL